MIYGKQGVSGPVKIGLHLDAGLTWLGGSEVGIAAADQKGYQGD